MTPAQGRQPSLVSSLAVAGEVATLASTQHLLTPRHLPMLGSNIHSCHDLIMSRHIVTMTVVLTLYLGDDARCHAPPPGPGRGDQHLQVGEGGHAQHGGQAGAGQETNERPVQSVT